MSLFALEGVTKPRATIQNRKWYSARECLTWEHLRLHDRINNRVSGTRYYFRRAIDGLAQEGMRLRHRLEPIIAGWAVYQSAGTSPLRQHAERGEAWK